MRVALVVSRLGIFGRCDQCAGVEEVWDDAATRCAFKGVEGEAQSVYSEACTAMHVGRGQL